MGVLFRARNGNAIIAAVMRSVGERLGNTPAVARASHVSPAVIEQYLDGRTIDDFRPRHLRVVGARDVGLDAERAGGSRAASVVSNSPRAKSCVVFRRPE
jgi:DNA topoisomerase IB